MKWGAQSSCGGGAGTTPPPLATAMIAANKAHFLQPIFLLKWATAKTICAVKSHLAHLQHSITLKKQEAI